MLLTLTGPRTQRCQHQKALLHWQLHRHQLQIRRQMRKTLICCHEVAPGFVTQLAAEAALPKGQARRHCTILSLFLTLIRDHLLRQHERRLQSRQRGGRLHVRIH